MLEQGLKQASAVLSTLPLSLWLARWSEEEEMAFYKNRTVKTVLCQQLSSDCVNLSEAWDPSHSSV